METSVHGVSALRWNLCTAEGLKSCVVSRLAIKLIILYVQIVRSIALYVEKYSMKNKKCNNLIEDNTIL